MNYLTSATLNGFSGGGKLKTITIYCVSRDLIIHCNENNLNWWLKNANIDIGND